MILDILIFFAIFIVIFYATAMLLTAWLRWRLSKTQNQLTETLEQLVHKTVEQHVIVMRIEHDPSHGYFAYREADGDFLAHGATIEALMDNFAQRFPNKTGLVPNHEGSGQEYLRSFVA